MTTLLTHEFFKILSHFPLYSILYSLFLSCFAAGTLALYEVSGKGLPTDIGDSMFQYLIIIVAWLVTTRPTYSLTIHDLLTDHVHSMLENLYALKNQPDPESEAECLSLLYYITLTLGSVANPAFQYLMPVKPAPKSKLGTDILAELRTIKMRQRLALPRSLHGLCIILIIGFHGMLLPLILYDNNTWYCLIPNAVLAIYTTGCLQVSITISDPYHNLLHENQNAALDYFQEQFHTILRPFTNAKGGKKSRTRDQKTALINDLVSLGVPEPVFREEETAPQFRSHFADPPSAPQMYTFVPI